MYTAQSLESIIEFSIINVIIIIPFEEKHLNLINGNSKIRKQYLKKKKQPKLKMSIF